MPISKKVLILLTAIASQLFLFYILSSLITFPKSHSPNYPVASSNYGPYIINVHSVKYDDSSSGNELEILAKAENTISQPLDKPFKQRVDGRLTKLNENIVNPENITAEKLAYFPKEKGLRQEDWEKSYEDKKIKITGDKRKIVKLISHKQFNYAGLAPKKRDITENNRLSSEKNDSLKMILSKISSAKYYPLIAKKRGLQGDALLRFELKTDGALEKVTIIKSSGSSILDKTAVNTVKKAAPFPYINGSIDIVLSYQFNE